MKPLASALDILQGEKEMSLEWSGVEWSHKSWSHLLRFNTASLWRLLLLLVLRKGIELFRNIPNKVLCRYYSLLFFCRFETSMNEKCHVIGALLLPRFRLQWVPECRRELLTRLVWDETAHMPQEAPSEVNILQAPSRNNDFFEFEDASSTQGSASGEPESFLVSQQKDLDVVLAYPSLKKLFLKHNTAVPSSASVERFFIIGGQVFESSPLSFIFLTCN